MSGTLRLWDVETGACQRTLTGHSERIRRIEYSPDGNQIASASDDKTVRLWDVKTGIYRYILNGHKGGVSRVAYSPQGDQVASANYGDRTVRLWDTESGECLYTLVGHKNDIDAIAYSPGGNLLAAWSDNGEARLWDVETGDCYWTLHHDWSIPPTGNLLSHPFVWMSPDDSFIAGCGDGSVRRWDVVKEGDRYHVQMRWRSSNGQLTVENACVQGVHGLSDLNRRLLKQRGATGEPSVRLRETSKKVMTLASVVSELYSSSSGTDALDLSPTSPTMYFTSHSEQQAEQAMDTGTLEN
jgi:WD40 repeat protein